MNGVAQPRISRTPQRALLDASQGLAAPDAPPIPDFKPCFTAGAWASVREVAQTLVRKVYEIIAVRRLGYARAEPFLRDYRLWIRDVLAFKFRCGICSAKHSQSGRSCFLVDQSGRLGWAHRNEALLPSRPRRQSPPLTRFYKYLFATLHGALLWYAADCTVNVVQLMYTASRLPDKTRPQRVVFVARGSVGQVGGCEAGHAP